MERERFRRIQEVFVAALDRSADERDAFLDDACAGDAALRAVVTRYLKADAEHFSLLDALPDDVREEPFHLSEGQTIGAYRVERLLGQGGMGVVYKALDEKLNRAVALKFLPSHLSADERAKERFIHEAQAAAALDHPHVGTIYEIAETPSGRLYIAMAYYDGETLKERIARGPVPATEAVRIAMQTARGLEVAHRRGVIHRDIKPANLILTTEGLVKIVDFGIAKLAGRDETQAGTMVGTLAYMSPEQTAGEVVDHRSDLWSLGVVLYEMISGRRPFEEDYLDALQYAIRHETPTPLVETPDAVRRVVDRLLEKDPEARYGDAAEIITDLERTLSPRADLGSSLPDNLPIPLTSFVGRNRELKQVTSLLEYVRLVTLTGTGGAGKTRLGLELALSLRQHFEDGVTFVSLEAVRDPELVASTIAQTLGVRDVGEMPVIQRLSAFLKEKRALLMLDNFEHVVAAAPLLAELLSACPKLSMLVTSRVPLRIRGEHEFPVPPLGLPVSGSTLSPDTLVRTEAAALFVQRARAVRPSFELTAENAEAVAEICRRLDGLPLALELAAARIKMLSPGAICSRLQHRLALLTAGARDMPARHRTLREAIAWSYDLLTKEEKRLLRGFSIFVGGWTLDSAEAVFSRVIARDSNMLEIIASLVDKNLVRQEEQSDGEPRFAMMETIREFALECLTGSGEEPEVRQAHRDFFLALAETAEPLLTGPEQAFWLERLERENDNIRAALDWILAYDRNSSAGARIGAACWRFWLVRGYLTEGRKHLSRLLESDGQAAVPSDRARLLIGSGALAQNQGDYATARARFEEALGLYRELGDVDGEAAALNHLGWIGWRLSDYEFARNLSEEALVLHRLAGSESGIATSLNNLGWVALYQGDYEAAQSHFEKSLELRRAVGDERGTAFALTNLGRVFHQQGRLEEAASLLNEALVSFEDIGDKQLLAFALNILADVVRDQGDNPRARKIIEAESLPLVRDIGSKHGTALALLTLGDVVNDERDHVRASRLYRQSMELWKETGDRWGIARSLSRLGRIAYHHGAHDEAAALYKESLEMRLGMGDKDGVVECLEGMAILASGQGRYEHAATLLGAVQDWREETDAPIPLRDRHERDELTAFLNASLGNTAFSLASDAGRTMTLTQAAAHATEGK